MPLRTVYLHLGYPKTGTSSIQVFLRDNRQALTDLGYYVPNIGQGRAGGHHTLVRALAGLPVPPHQAVLESDIMRELAGAVGSIVISSEMLTGILANSGQAAALISKLNTVSEKIAFILYVRNQAQWFNSAYSQGIKSFRRKDDFQHFVAAALSNVDAYGYTNWIRIAQRDRADLLVRPFSQNLRSDGVVGDFLRVLGVPLSLEFAPPQRINESAGPLMVEAARRLINEIPGGLEALTFMQSTRLKLALQREYAALGISDVSYCGLTTALAFKLNDAFAEQNNRFANQVWGVDWDAIFFDDLRQEFVSNDYKETGVPPNMNPPLNLLVGKMQHEIKIVLSNPRLATAADWNARRV